MIIPYFTGIFEAAVKVLFYEMLTHTTPSVPEWRSCWTAPLNLHWWGYLYPSHYVILIYHCLEVRIYHWTTLNSARNFDSRIHIYFCNFSFHLLFFVLFYLVVRFFLFYGFCLPRSHTLPCNFFYYLYLSSKMWPVKISVNFPYNHT